MGESDWVGVSHEAALSSRGTPNSVCVVWKIKDFAADERKVGEEIKSPKFYFSSAVWTLSLYPYGNTDADSKYISLFLNCETPSTTVYDMKVKFQLTDDWGVCLKSREFTNISVCKTSRGYPHFQDRNQKSSFLTKKNRLIIKCDVLLNGKSELQDTEPCISEMLSEFSISDKNCSLMKTFQEAYGNEEFSDVIVRVGGEEIPAHKIILTSRSKVFRAMLANDMKEIQDGAIDLKEIDASVAKEMLRFMYTENVQALSFDKTLELYVAADQYDLQALRQKCRDFLMECLSFDNVCEVIAVADLHSDDVLSVRSREFFYANFKHVLRTEKWASLESEKPEFCYSLVKAILESLI